MSFVDFIVGALVGIHDNGIDWDAKARSDERRIRTQRYANVYAAGWRDWLPPYMSTLDREGVPYAYPRVWIWRLEWDFPQEVDPNKLDPQMNVMGLLWKPWAP